MAFTPQILCKTSGNEDTLLRQALEVYLNGAKMSMLKATQEVETETLLYQNVPMIWLCALDNARNVLSSIDICDTGLGKNLLTAAVALSASDKAETAFVWSVQEVRALRDHDAQLVYSTAASLMLSSQRCLQSALHAYQERGRALQKLWIAAAETVSDSANIVVLTKRVGERDRSARAKLDIANQVSEARATADAAEVDGHGTGDQVAQHGSFVCHRRCAAVL